MLSCLRQSKQGTDKNAHDDDSLVATRDGWIFRSPNKSSESGTFEVKYLVIAASTNWMLLCNENAPIIKMAMHRVDRLRVFLVIGVLTRCTSTNAFDKI